MNVALVIISAILFSAFFSGMEIAFISSNKLRIEIDRQKGRFGSGIIATLSQKPEQFILTMLIGNNIALVVYGLYIAGPLESLFSGFIRSDLLLLLLQIIFATTIILLIAEFLPKLSFRSSPNKFLKSLSLPAAAFYILFYPITFLIIKLSYLLLKIFAGAGPEYDAGKKVFGKVDLEDLVSDVHEDDTTTDLEEHDVRIFQKALDLANVKVRGCMIPRTEIEALSAGSSTDEIRQAFIETGHSSILIFEDSIDNIIGYFRLRDLLATPADISKSIRKLPIVPESMAANKLLKLFVEQNKKLALVVDEFGGTSGMVTIEDILEEIVGNIEDEHDSSELIVKKTGEDEYLFSGRTEIDNINETYGLSLPVSEDYETLAGLVLINEGTIPKINTPIRIGEYIIRVIKVSETRLELINVKKRPGKSWQHFPDLPYKSLNQK